MRPHLRLSSLALAALVFTSVGCSNGGSVTPSGSGSQSTGHRGNVVLSGTINGSGPQFLAHVRRLSSLSRRAQATFTFKNILVQGTFFPGDAGDNIVSNSTTIPVPTNNVYSASVSFSNVPVHNNEWGLLQFIGVATDGSQIALGELAGIVNVTASPTNSATLTEATTQTFQVFSMLGFNGEISTNDLDSNATLATNIGSDITATGVTPDPVTHLFDANQLLTLNNAIAPKFERNATITASPSVSGSFIFLRDYTNASELDLVSNFTNFFQFFIPAVQTPVVGGVLGGTGGVGSCGYLIAVAPLHSPSTNPPPVPSDVDACVITGSGSTTLRNVYGGHVLIGATNNPFSALIPSAPPFNGGFTSFAGHAPGTYTATVTTKATSSIIKVTDLAGFAFGATFFASEPPLEGSAFFLKPAFGNTQMSATQFTASTAAGLPFRIAIPTPYSSTSNSLTVDTLTPWNIASTNLQLCGGVSCYALSAAQPLAISRVFADAGTKATFFNWKPSGTATKITQGSGMYTVTVSGAGTATLTTTVASTLIPRQQIAITGTLPFPSTVTVTAKDAASNSYVNTAPVSNPSEVSVMMDSVGNQVATTSIAISFTTIAAGSFSIFEITAQ